MTPAGPPAAMSATPIWTVSLSEDNARAVAEICVCLDGLPLAIELAAARSRIFSPQALLDRLRGTSGPTALQFLVGGPRDLPAHQQTLRGTLDWSYELLDQREQTLLARLGVFVGGCTLEAAAAICGDCRLQIVDCKLDEAASPTRCSTWAGSRSCRPSMPARRSCSASAWRATATSTRAWRSRRRSRTWG
ncbi:MAG TPA: hypothetical protein VF897_14390 [Roseiflexaceae bacterium]